MRATITLTQAVREPEPFAEPSRPQLCNIPLNHSRTHIPADSWPVGQAQLQWSMVGRTG